jgi:hypothetical protein
MDQDWNTPFESESNAWGGTEINDADFESNDWAGFKNQPERGQGRSGHQESVDHYDESELGSRTEHRSRKSRNERDDMSRSEHGPPRRSTPKSRNNELSQSQHCPSRSTPKSRNNELSQSQHCPSRSSKTRVHRQGQQEEFKVNANYKFGEEEEDAFGPMFVAEGTTSYFRKSLESSSSHRKDNPANHEYEEEPGDMTFGMQERGHHDDLGPKRSGRTPRRSASSVNMGEDPSNRETMMRRSASSGDHAGMMRGRGRSSGPTNGKPQHDIDNLLQKRASRMSSSKANSTWDRDALQDSFAEEDPEDDPWLTESSEMKRNTPPGRASSNLNAFLKIQTEFAPRQASSGSRSVQPTSSVTDPRKNPNARYEYGEEPRDMTFGKQERGGQHHDDLGPPKRRTARRSSIGAPTPPPSSADSSLFTAPVDGHQNSTRSRRRGSIAGPSSMAEMQKSDPRMSDPRMSDPRMTDPRMSDPRMTKRNAPSGSSNLNSFFQTESPAPKQSSGSRSVQPTSTFTEARKNPNARYEYGEEPRDMTFGKQEQRGHHDDLGPPKRRTARRSSIGAPPPPSASRMVPSSMNNQQVAETYSADSSGFPAPVDAQQIPGRSRRRGSIAGPSSIVERNYETQKSDPRLSDPRMSDPRMSDPRMIKRNASSGSSNLNAFFQTEPSAPKQSSGSRSVQPTSTFTEARKNPNARYEYGEEPSRDMTFGNQEQRGQHHDDLGPPKRRTARRSSIGAPTPSADTSGFPAPVDGPCASRVRTRRRGSIAGY